MVIDCGDGVLVAAVLVVVELGFGLLGVEFRFRCRCWADEMERVMVMNEQCWRLKETTS